MKRKNILDTKVTRNKANRKLVSIDEKVTIMRLFNKDISLTDSERSLKESIIKMLPKNCFFDNNHSSILIEEVEKFFVTNENFSFIDEIAKNWKPYVVQFESPFDKYETIRTLAVLTYHCSFNNDTIKKIAKAMNVKVENSRTHNPDEFLNSFANTFSLDVVNTSLDFYKYRDNTMASTLLVNATKNLNNFIKNSKSKKIKDMNITFAHDDAKLCKYPGDSNYRADFVICYDEDGEHKRLFHEHFGWNGSFDYDQKVSEKIKLAADNSIPLWYTIDSSKNVDIVDKSKGLILSVCEKSVYDWTLSNKIKLDSTIDSLYIAIEHMLEYIGIEKFNATVSSLFKA